jgi:O-antigen ligase
VLGATVAVFLMIFWAVDDGGFDPGVWYWGALLALAALAGALIAGRGALATLPRPLKLALGLFAGYVGWSYLSMSWAAYPGLALQGSNRALLYLVLFALMAVLPWRRATALLALGTFAVGIGVIAVALLFRFALGDHIPAMFLQGRLVYPTGYFNSTAALFTIGALVSVALGAHRGLAGPLRGLLLALTAADLMLAVTVQSRGWLFTLPIVGLYAALVIAGRLRAVGHALAPVAGTLAVIHPMLRVYQVSQNATLTRDAVHAGKLGLLSCAAVFAVATLAAWVESARRRPPLGPLPRRMLGTGAVLLALAGLGGGLVVLSSGHPGPFISRQWHGFTREPATTNSHSHFDEVGSGRYDIWRSSLDAFRAHPIGGLGQDNFGDWYLTHRHTAEEPLWTHSLELRLLAHTGIVGFLLFAGFLAAAFAAALAARRRGELADRMLVGAALLPLGVWVIHGSIDWFWEVPALSGPALGFLAMAGRLGSEPAAAPGSRGAAAAEPAGATPQARRRLPAVVSAGAGVLALAAATVVLGLPYLAVRELNDGEAVSHTDVAASLADFRSSHRLNPLMSDPGVLGGTVALVNGHDAAAAAWYRQAIAREPGQWVAWLGRGLAASAQGQVTQAHRAFVVAHRLDGRQPVTGVALRRVGTDHPLAPAEAFAEINYLP